MYLFDLWREKLARRQCSFVVVARGSDSITLTRLAQTIRWQVGQSNESKGYIIFLGLSVIFDLPLCGFTDRNPNVQKNETGTGLSGGAAILFN